MKKRTKTERQEQLDRLREARELIEREWAKIREQKAREASSTGHS